MFVTVSRVLPSLSSNHALKLIRGCKSPDASRILYQKNVRQHHSSLWKRRYIIPNNIVNYTVRPIGNAGICRDCISFSGVRLGSTFIVETPGKLEKSVNNNSAGPPTAAVSPEPVTASNAVLDPIPDIPSILVQEATEITQVIGEPTFESLGLGGWSPVGILQHSLEFLHIDCGLPWWGAIALGTAVVRVILFPLVIIAQRNAAKLNNNLPQLQIIQLKMTEARQNGNHLEAARYSQELMQFMKEKDVNPLKNMIVPLVQAPIFISFFMGLRGMANLPVESLMTGGMFWFTDLTMPDQYYLLPLITSASLYLTIELGTDTARLSSSNMQTMKYVLRALPVMIFPFTMNFPGAVLCYWVSSNIISLAQVGFLKIPTIRDYFKIDPRIDHDPSSLPMKPKGFVKGFKDSWSNMKIVKELEERERFDEHRFRQAGTAPLQKTYKYNPTQQNAVSAKKQEH